MAEIEHFCDPTDKSHTKFHTVQDIQLTLYSALNQMNGELPKKETVGDAVKKVSLTFFCAHCTVCTVQSRSDTTGLNTHLFADDTQIDRSYPPGATAQLLLRVSACIDEVAQCMHSNKVQPNTTKTKVL